MSSNVVHKNTQFGNKDLENIYFHCFLMPTFWYAFILKDRPISTRKLYLIKK